MSADAGADHRAMVALQERADRQDAEIVKLQGQIAALGNRVVALETKSTKPKNLEVMGDGCPMPEAERKAMVAKLRARTAAGIEANKKDRYRAGRTYRREGFDVK